MSKTRRIGSVDDRLANFANCWWHLYVNVFPFSSSVKLLKAFEMNEQKFSQNDVLFVKSKVCCLSCCNWKANMSFKKFAVESNFVHFGMDQFQNCAGLNEDNAVGFHVKRPNSMLGCEK